MHAIDDGLAARLHRQAKADRWSVPVASFAAALERSAAKAFAGRSPSASQLDGYLSSLHLGDLALACACEAGDHAAWDHFVLEFRPTLYRAADAIDPSGGARELADSLYGELYGLKEAKGTRQSLFRYFHGRSSLATWLRAVLSQRHVDRLRAGRRLEPLPEENSFDTLASATPAPDADRPRLATAIERALSAAIAALDPKDRLRLGCYYAQEMTLAAIGRLVGEHEATASRQLAKTRRALREDVERRLRTDHGLDERGIAEAFAAVLDDAGAIDLGGMLGRAGRKNAGVDRSTSEGMP